MICQYSHVTYDWSELLYGRVNCCCSLLAQSFLFPSPTGLMTVFYCLTNLEVMQVSPIVMYASVAAGTSLSSPCLATTFFFGSTIPAVRRHFITLSCETPLNMLRNKFGIQLGLLQIWGMQEAAHTWELNYFWLYFCCDVTQEARI
jgi:hypothetical protein